MTDPPPPVTRRWKVEERARALQAEGWRSQKWFLAHGPAEGREGLLKNVDLVRRLRETVGDATDLMFDAFMGWDLPYALAWAKEAEPFRPRWIEEAFPPDNLESFAALREATSIPVASGEHFYGRWEVERYLNARALHVVQADPEWCGGTRRRPRRRRVWRRSRHPEEPPSARSRGTRRDGGSLVAGLERRSPG